MTKYYLDSCIWMDFYEDRFGIEGRPLGGYAAQLFIKILKNNDKVLFSDLVVEELKAAFTEPQIEEMFEMMHAINILNKVDISKQNIKEAKEVSQVRKVPRGDAIHAVVARNNDAILVSQDKHFQLLRDIVEVKKPEELL